MTLLGHHNGNYETRRKTTNYSVTDIPEKERPHALVIQTSKSLMRLITCHVCFAMLINEVALKKKTMTSLCRSLTDQW